MYGLGFWLNLDALRKDSLEYDIEETIELSQVPWRRSCLSKSSPDLIVMAGSHGQRVYVSPSQDLIVVRLGRRAGFRDRIFLERCFDNSWLALRATKKTARGANRVLFLTRTTQQAFIPRSPRVRPWRRLFHCEKQV